MFRIGSPAVREAWPTPGDRALYVLIKERKFGAGCVDAWQRDHPPHRQARRRASSAATPEPGVRHRRLDRPAIRNPPRALSERRGPGQLHGGPGAPRVSSSEERLGAVVSHRSRIGELTSPFPARNVLQFESLRPHPRSSSCRGRAHESDVRRVRSPTLGLNPGERRDGARSGRRAARCSLIFRRAPRSVKRATKHCRSGTPR